MATVTGLTADRMLEIEAASVVDGDIVGDNLILTKHDGSQVNAGNVRGPQGVQGPIGQDISVLSAVSVLDIGLTGHIRAGRQLTASDFTNMGLSAPLGLWNLSDLSDSSGNGRSLLNKGAVPFSSGINGQANTAARFSGVVGQALYIADAGVADPFRIRVGSWGCWFRTAKIGVAQTFLGKYGSGAGNSGWVFQTTAQNTLSVVASITGSAVSTFTGISNVCDDRWHFAVAINDGSMLRLYVDGVLEVIGVFDLLFPVNGPVNIGAFGTDAATNGTLPHYGSVDEAFVTSDILSEDQVRNLYCCKIPHTLSAIPTRASINIRRRRKGAALTVADFTTQPIRLHNFSAGSLGDEGSGGIGLLNNGGALSVAGVDGTLGNAFNFSGTQYLSSTDVGLPSAVATRSYGCWFKTVSSATQILMVWGGASGLLNIQLLTGAITCVAFNGSSTDTITGPNITDGQWHQVIAVEDNAPTPNDGIKRKLYVDGRLVGSSITSYSFTGVGANGFRIGANHTAAQFVIGQIDGVFVCNYAMTVAEVMRLYAKGSQVLTPSPKNSGDHVEGMTSTDLFCIFDSLDSQHQVDLGVA